MIGAAGSAIISSHFCIRMNDKSRCNFRTLDVSCVSLFIAHLFFPSECVSACIHFSCIIESNETHTHTRIYKDIYTYGNSE